MARKIVKQAPVVQPKPRTRDDVLEDLRGIENFVRENLRSNIERVEARSRKLTADMAVNPVQTLEQFLRWGEGHAEEVQLARIAQDVFSVEERFRQDGNNDPLFNALRAVIEEATRALLRQYDKPNSTSISANMEAMAKNAVRARFIESWDYATRTHAKLVGELSTFAMEA